MLSKLFWAISSPLLRRPSFHRRLNSFILQSQARLGVGAGGYVETSGEEVVLQLLIQEAVKSPQKQVCVFDVGANHGQYLGMVLQKLAAHKTTVHSFEPSASAFDILQKRFASAPQVHLNHFGLGDQSGEFNLFSDALGSGLGSLTKRRLDHLGIHYEQCERVQIKTLDDYCATREIQIIDLLKIDVEGHELDVLRGADATFGRGGVRFLTFEFGGCNIDTRTYVRDFYNFFADRGMKSFHRIMPCGRLFRIGGYSESLEAFGTTNFLVVLDGTVQTDFLE